LNWNDGNIFYFTDFDDNMEANLVLPLTREIQHQRRLKHGQLDLYINSFGGYGHLVDHLVELVGLAKRNDIVVRTIVPSLAASAGSMLAITGTPGERYIARSAEHIVHYGTTIGTAETTPKQIERWAGFKNRDFKNVLTHYRKHCDIPNLDAEMMDDGFSIPATKAIAYGMADKYLEKFDIGFHQD
jgi:ATP-dependent protease ClpP protease subunit